jgi:dihydrolipoamide dehydrogenase
VDLRIGVTVTEVRRPAGTGPVTLTLEDGSEVAAHEALLATGRAPLTDDIGLDTVAWSRGRAGGRRHPCRATLGW